MTIEAVGNVGSYQAAAPKMAEPVKVAEPVKAVEPVKPVVKQQTGAKSQAGGTEAVDKNDLSSASMAETLKAQNEITQEKMHKALDDINKRLSNTSCEYGYDDTTNRVTIKIIDKETDEIIRELPPEKTLEMIAKAWELAGILVDERL